MSQSPGLNYDIWREVFQTCARPDCARLMRTCRFLYAHGFAALLAHHVSLETKTDVARFLLPLQKHADERCKYLRSLYLGFFGLNHPVVLKLLGHALRRMSNLKKISIVFSEDVVSSHPDLLDAFAALPSLRELTLGHIGVHAARMLRSLRSKLTVANLDFLGVGSGPPFFNVIPDDEIKLYHPAVLLVHSRSSLRDLSSHSWYMDAETLPNRKLVYRQMHRLHLESVVLPRTMAFIQAYPNLTHLSFLIGDMEPDTSYHAFDIARYNVRHTQNVTEQVDSGRTWAALRKFTGCLLDLYVLDLTCPVDTLHLHGMCDDLVYMLDPALSHTRPRHLTLHNWPKTLRGAPADIFSGLCGQGSSRLLTLCIDTGLDEDDDDVDVAAVFEGLRASLLGTPLVDLQVRIGTTALDPRPDDFALWKLELERLPTPPSPDPPEEYALCFAEGSAEDFDLEDYMRRFVEEIPTLRRANVILDGPRDRWRRPTIVDGQPRIKDKSYTRVGGEGADSDQDCDVRRESTSS